MRAAVDKVGLVVILFVSISSQLARSKFRVFEISEISTASFMKNQNTSGADASMEASEYKAQQEYIILENIAKERVASTQSIKIDE